MMMKMMTMMMLMMRMMRMMTMMNRKDLILWQKSAGKKIGNSYQSSMLNRKFFGLQYLHNSPAEIGFVVAENLQYLRPIKHRVGAF